MNTVTEDRVQGAIDSIINMFENNTYPEAIARTVLHRQATDAPSSTWSMGNILLMLMSGTDDARGFDQWKQVGRTVKKGAKAFYILGPKLRKVTDDQGEEKRVITGFVSIPVFRYDDTDGAEIARPDYAPAVMPPLSHVADAFGVKVAYGPFAERYYGYYRPSTNAIMLCTHDVSVFFHELAHAVHGTFRTLKGGQDQAQEIVAETVAAVLCKLYGFDGFIGTNAQYIRKYAKDNPSKAVMKVLADVQKVLALILDADANKSDVSIA